MLHTLITSLRTETKRVEKCTWSTYYEASDEVFAPLMLLQYQGLVRSLHKLHRSFGNVWGCLHFNFAMVKTKCQGIFLYFFEHILITKIRTPSCWIFIENNFCKKEWSPLNFIYCQNVNLLYSFCWLFTGIYFITLKTFFYPLLFMPFTHVEAIVNIYLKADNSLAFHG